MSSTATDVKNECCTAAPAADASCCGGEAKANPLGHHGAICHVEFTAPDLAKAKDFYGPLFKWDFFPMGEGQLYFMSAKGGPCGCLFQGAAPSDTKTTIYVNVDDISATLAHAGKLGGTVTLPKTEIPGGHGFIGHVRGPEGNVFGLYNRS